MTERTSTNSLMHKLILTYGKAHFIFFCYVSLLEVLMEKFVQTDSKLGRPIG